MTKRTLALASLLFAIAHCVPATGPKTASTHVLPLRHVRLFESGIGYFERSGELQAGETTSLPVPASHLDDALKTLVILGADSKVDGLTFATTESFGLARARAGLPTDPAANITFVDMMKALRGETVRVVSKTDTFHATLIDVESEVTNLPGQPPIAASETRASDTESDASGASPKTPPAGQHLERRLVLYTTDNQVVRVPFDRLLSVAPTSPIIQARIVAALQPGGNQAANTQKMLALLGDTKGKVAFGYVSEVPLWRTSYRAVLGKDKSVLQAWALIHNDTDEAWRGVEVQLANGRPDSFLFPLAMPRYGRRPMLKPNNEMSTLPQLLTKSPDDIAGELVGDVPGDAFGYGGLGLTGTGLGGGGRSEGIAGDNKQSVSGGGGTAPTLAMTSDSTSEASGNLFIYTLQNRLDVAPHSSALVPYLARDIEIDRVTYFASLNASAVGAVHFTNNTPQTLPAGTISFFDAGGFVGEALLDRMGPNAKAYVGFGVDLDVTLKDDATTKTIARELRSKDGWIYLHSVRSAKHHTTLKNAAGDEKKVAIAFPGLVAKAVFTPPTGVDFSAVPTLTLSVAAQKELVTDYTIDENVIGGVTYASKPLTELASNEAIPAAQRAIVNEIIDKAKIAEKSEKTIRDLEQTIHAADVELTRLREHLKALGDKNAADAHSVMTRILQAEDSLKNAQKQRDDLKKALEDQWAACRKIAEKLPAEDAR